MLSAHHHPCVCARVWRRCFALPRPCPGCDGWRHEMSAAPCHAGAPQCARRTGPARCEAHTPLTRGHEPPCARVPTDCPFPAGRVARGCQAKCTPVQGCDAYEYGSAGGVCNLFRAGLSRGAGPAVDLGPSGSNELSTGTGTLDWTCCVRGMAQEGACRRCRACAARTRTHTQRTRARTCVGPQRLPRAPGVCRCPTSIRLRTTAPCRRCWMYRLRPRRDCYPHGATRRGGVHACVRACMHARAPLTAAASTHVRLSCPAATSRLSRRGTRIKTQALVPGADGRRL